MKTNRFLFFLLLPLLVFGQKSEQVGGMTISWKYSQNEVHFQLTAPNDGWVALGFNHKNDIKDTHLLMFSIENQRQAFEELYVKAAGNPLPVKSLFERETKLKYACTEKGKTTTVTFSIDLGSYPEFSTKLSEGTEVWLICAYAEEDDFGHHSMMRKHIKVVL